MEPKPCRCQAALTDAFGDVQGDECPRSPNGGAHEIPTLEVRKVVPSSVTRNPERREAYCSVVL